jgi:hypothetical protein
MAEVKLVLQPLPEDKVISRHAGTLTDWACPWKPHLVVHTGIRNSSHARGYLHSASVTREVHVPCYEAIYEEDAMIRNRGNEAASRCHMRINPQMIIYNEWAIN